MLTIVLPLQLPAVSSLYAARMAYYAMLVDQLPLIDGMADVLVSPGEPDQLPTDGVWMDRMTIEDSEASLGRGARTESAEMEIIIWVSRDGNDSLYAEERAFAIRDAIRSLERDNTFLEGYANLWSEPVRDVMELGIAGTHGGVRHHGGGGARCALITHTVNLEVRS